MGRRRAQTAAWLRRVDSESFEAFAINCTHLGCPVRWIDTAQLFMCPCHGGVFNADGSVAADPPEKPLSLYPVRVSGTDVQIQAGVVPIFALAVVICVLLLAIFVGPPHLDVAPDPANVNAFPRPDWYLLWYYALLGLLRPAFESWFIVLAPLLGFGLLFIIPLVRSTGERSPIRRPSAPAAVVGLVVMIGALWRYGAVAPWSQNFNTRPATAPVTSGPAADGPTLFYNKGCQYCHTVAGAGGRRGPDLTHVADRLSQGEIIAAIDNGPGSMPAYVDNLTPAETQALVAFLEAEQHPAQVAATPGSEVKTP